MQAKKYDLFISYVDADRAWVEGYLLDALQQANVRYLVETAFTPGAPRIAEFERAIEQCDRTLLVLSHAYLANDVTEFIRLLGQSYGLDKGIWPVIPLITDETLELPPSLSALVPLKATDEDESEKAIERLCQDLQRSVPDSPSKPECPYPGMTPFSEENSDRFFGRDQEIKQLLQHLRHHNFVSVIGPSGSGKSSLVFAGLIPYLKNLKGSGLFEDGKWLIRKIRPGEKPLTALKTELGSDLADPTLAVTTALATQDNTRRLLLVVDQFEEVFTQAEQEAELFQKVLLGLLEIPDCYVILTVRADFYPELMESMLWDQIQRSRLEIVPLNGEGLREAITKPAEKVKVFIESVLVERLVADAAEEPGVLPIVQEAMVWLWEKLERRFLPFRAYDTLVLTSTSYEKIDGSNRKGLQAVIANHADSTVIKLSKEEQQIAWRIFLRLIQFGEGRADTRRQQSVEQLKALGENPELFDRTLYFLAENRLLTLNAGKDGSSINVDIAHEALIEGWPALQWRLEKRREAEQTRRRLMRQVQDWVNLGKGKGGLLDETELAEAGRWLSSPDADELGYDQTLLELVKASDRVIEEARQREEEARQREEEARQREYKLLQERMEQEKKASEQAEKAREQAEKAREQAEKAREQAEKARKATQTRNRSLMGATTTAVGLLIALNLATQRQVDNLATLSESRLSQNNQLKALIAGVKAARRLKWWMPNSVRMKTIATLQQAVYQTQEINRLEGHSQRINSVSSCSDEEEKIIASGSDDGTIQIWKPDGKAAIPEPLNHQPRVTSVAFSPDCSILVSGSTDGTVILWNENNGQWLRKSLIVDNKLPQDKAHNNWVSSVAFSHDGKFIATASRRDQNTTNNDETVKLWKITNGKGELIHRLRYNSSVNDVSFSPDGSILASADSETVRLWDTKKGNSIQEPIKGHQDYVNSVRFSPNGQFLASASSDSTVKLWKVKNGVVQTPEWETLHDPEDQVTSICFSPDGKFLAAASEDSNLWLWLLNDENIPSPKTIKGHSSEIRSVSCSPDNKTLISTGEDKTIRIWNIPPLQEDTSTELNSVSVSPDGETLAMAHRDGRIWLCPRDQIAPDREDKTIGLSDCVDASVQKKRLLKHSKGVTRLILSPDQKTLASIDGDYQTIRLWNSGDGSPIEKPLTGHQDSVTSLSFSPNSQILASGSEDKSIQLWNAADGNPIGEPLRDHHEGVTSLSFSPDGKMLASGDKNGIIKLWPHSDGRVPNTPDRTLDKAEDKHNLEIAALSFSPDGKMLASASWDNTIKLWRVKDGSLMHTLTGHTNGVTSVTFSSDGKTLVSGSDDQTIKLWNPTEGTLLKTLVGHSKTVDSVQFSADGKTLISIDQDEKVLLWDFSLDSLLRRGCDRIQDYLTTNRNVSKSDQKICQDL
ncbi:MAG: TIR domain-containing protein [Moorea sp. SIO1F2]|uniref:nSTAND1 domain-containing NTPase n=1 Tax=Moorena sp. SIO1F2 TaxID=2607819 RepID=UPI0013BE340E|nr:TIR domain-containing protein [Moorena sp. SIO1F2]NET81162.1 TIR domain-containing protein [Moorena sp. SIO1F2]